MANRKQTLGEEYLEFADKNGDQHFHCKLCRFNMKNMRQVKSHLAGQSHRDRYKVGHIFDSRYTTFSMPYF